MRRLAGAAVVACGIGAARRISRGPGRAQTPPVLLVLDETAIDHGPPPHLIPADAVNDQISNVGLREPIPYFSARVGTSVTLPGGQDGNDGWFALRTVPASWASEPGKRRWPRRTSCSPARASDHRTTPAAARPFSAACRTSSRCTRRASASSSGRSVCAVVYDGDITASTDPEVGTSLAGANLGAAAFEVTSVGVSADEWPAVTVQILDVHETCGGAIGAFSEAP